jgi:hypothetical protein
LLLLPSLAYPADPWDKTDVGLAIAASVVTVIDWGQSRYIAKHPGDWTEPNATIGHHPSVGRVNNYFGIVLVGGGALAHILPSPYRKMLLGGELLIEVNVTATNKSLGIGIAF